MNDKIEQTLSIIKPDAVERNLENEIKAMFQNDGFSILKEKKITISWRIIWRTKTTSCSWKSINDKAICLNAR